MPSYPDVDDTAMVMLALRQVDLESAVAVARERACLREPPLACSPCSRGNGGWGAFDKDNTRAFLARIPLRPTTNAIIDPPTPDITGRVLEFLGFRRGYDTSFPCTRAAVDFLRRTQETEARGRAVGGVNYLYGTWQVLRGLQGDRLRVGLPFVRRAVDWLIAVQLPRRRLGRDLRHV